MHFHKLLASLLACHLRRMRYRKLPAFPLACHRRRMKFRKLPEPRMCYCSIPVNS
jgi:hypothetical protein